MPRITGATDAQTTFLRAFRKNPAGPAAADWPHPAIHRRWLRKPAFLAALNSLQQTYRFQIDFHLATAAAQAAAHLMARDPAADPRANDLERLLRLATSATASPQPPPPRSPTPPPSSSATRSGNSSPPSPPSKRTATTAPRGAATRSTSNSTRMSAPKSANDSPNSGPSGNGNRTRENRGETRYIYGREFFVNRAQRIGAEDVVKIRWEIGRSFGSAWSRGVLAIGAVLALVVPARAAQIVFRTVALSGVAAPGTPAGAKFSSFGSSAIDANGGVTFFAMIGAANGGISSSNDGGIWSETSGQLRLVLREADPAPGADAGARFGTITSVVSNPAGMVVVRSSLQLSAGGVTASSDEGIWSGGVGSLNLIAREGDPAPGTLAGVNFDASLAGPLIGGGGQVVFRGRLATGGPGVTGNNNLGVWSGTSGNLALVVRTGSQAAGTPVGASFSAFRTYAINPRGNTALAATLQVGAGGVTSANDTGIWSEGHGSLSLIAREGSQPPGLQDGVTFAQMGNSDDAAPVINAAGRIAFTAAFQGPGVTVNNDSAVWSEGDHGLAMVVREGNQAPGTNPGTVFSDFRTAVPALQPVINSAGRVAFRAAVQQLAGGGPAADGGIWVQGDEGLRLVARAYTPAPGTPDGFVFDSFRTTSPSLNGAGRVAFYAPLLATAGGGVPTGEDAGLWAEDPSGDLEFVVRVGELFQVAPGDVRTIATIGFGGHSGGEDGSPVSFNDDFTLTYQLRFTDGTAGIFTTAVPEPATLANLTLATLVLARRRPRRADN